MIKKEKFESMAGSGECQVVHLGYQLGEIRLVFSCSGEPVFVLVIADVLRYFDHGLVGHGPVVVSAKSEIGSFGWDLPKDQRQKYVELHVNSKEDKSRKLFRVIAGSISFRGVKIKRDMNYPG